MCIEGTSLKLPALSGNCSVNEQDSPEYWRGRFCEDAVGFCEDLKRHPMPVPPCTKSRVEIETDFAASQPNPTDAAALYPKAGMDRVRQLLPSALSEIRRVLASDKWQAPPSVLDAVSRIHLVDPADPNTSPEDLFQLNQLCGTAVPVPGLESPKASELPDPRLTGVQAAVNGTGDLLVCPATLKLATEGSTEALLSVLLHELAHVAGGCNTGKAIVTELETAKENQSMELGDPKSCAYLRSDIEKLPDGGARLAYTERLIGRMNCFEDAGVSNPGKKAEQIARESEALDRFVSQKNAAGCLLAPDQWMTGKVAGRATGLMQTCQTAFFKGGFVNVYRELNKIPELKPTRAQKIARTVRLTQLLVLPNENQFEEALADQVAAESLPGTLEGMRESGALPRQDSRDALVGLLQAPATFCGFKIPFRAAGPFRNQLDHPNRDSRMHNWQWTPEMRKALACGTESSAATHARHFDACLRKDPLR